MIDLEIFKLNCYDGKCLRRTMLSKNCSKDFKQIACHIKYMKQIEKNKNRQEEKQEKLRSKKEKEIKEQTEIANQEWQIKNCKKELGIEEPIEYEVDQQYETFKKDVWEKYTGFYDGNVSDRKDWKDICMLWNSLSEQEKNLCDELNEKDYFINHHIDIAHLVSRSEKTTKIYDIDNVVLMGRLFHSRIDQYLNPITGEKINKFQRAFWLSKVKK